MTTDEAEVMGARLAEHTFETARERPRAFPGDPDIASELLVDEDVPAAEVEVLAPVVLAAARQRWTELVEDAEDREAYDRDRRAWFGGVGWGR